MNALFPVNDGLITCDNRLFDKSVAQNKIFVGYSQTTAKLPTKFN